MGASRFLYAASAVAFLAVYMYSTSPSYPYHFTMGDRLMSYAFQILFQDTVWKEALEEIGIVSSVDMTRILMAAAVKVTNWCLEKDNSLFKDSEVAGIPVRIFKQGQEKQTESKTRVAIFFHGGGFYGGDTATHHYICEHIALNTDMTVISVDYRLAPENVFPAAIDDAYTVTKAFMEDPSVDTNQVSLIGDSAGGNLVMAVIVRWRLEGMEKRIGKFASQVLIYPLLQIFYFNTASYLTPAEQQITTTTMTIQTLCSYYAVGNRSLVPLLQSGRAVSCRNMERIVEGLWGLVLRDDELHLCPNDTTSVENVLLNPIFSPLATESVKDFPPAFILTAEYDVIRDDGVIYANRLKQAGVHVETLYIRLGHAFVNFVKCPLCHPDAMLSMDSIVNFLNAKRQMVED